MSKNIPFLQQWVDRWNSYDRTTRFLIGSTFPLVLGRAISTPFISLLMIEQGLAAKDIGTILGVGVLIGSIVGLFAGRLADILPRAVVFHASLFVYGLGIMGVGYAASSWEILIAVTLISLGQASFEPVCRALMSDHIAPSLRGSAYSLRYLMVNVAFSIGPIIGASISGKGSLFKAAGLVYWLMIIAGLRFIQFRSQNQINPVSSVSTRAAVQLMMRDRRLFHYVLGGLFAIAVYMQFTVYLSLTAIEQFGQQKFAILMSLNGIVVCLAQIFLINHFEKANLRRLVLWGCLLMAAGELCWGFTMNQFWISFFGMILFSLGESVISPATYLLIDRIAPENLRGTYFGAQGLSNIGAFIGPMLSGHLLSAFGASMMYSVLAGLCVLALFIILRGISLKEPLPGDPVL